MARPGARVAAHFPRWCMCCWAAARSATAAAVGAIGHSADIPAPRRGEFLHMLTAPLLALPLFFVVAAACTGKKSPGCWVCSSCRQVHYRLLGAGLGHRRHAVASAAVLALVFSMAVPVHPGVLRWRAALRTSFHAAWARCCSFPGPGAGFSPAQWPLPRSSCWPMCCSRRAISMRLRALPVHARAGPGRARRKARSWASSCCARRFGPISCSLRATSCSCLASGARQQQAGRHARGALEMRDITRCARALKVWRNCARSLARPGR